MQEAKEAGERVVNDLCDAVRYLGDVSYAILPKDMAHNLADLKKSFLKNLRTLIDKTSMGRRRVAAEIAFVKNVSRIESRQPPAPNRPNVAHLLAVRTMEVLLAEDFDLLWVERAARFRNALEDGVRPIRSLGPLIHNAQEMERLGELGVSTIDVPNEADADTIAVIRAHGVTPQVQRELEGRAAKVIDATCPFVTRVQHLAERAAKEGRDVVVAGNPDHPEMIGVRWLRAQQYLRCARRQRSCCTAKVALAAGGFTNDD